LRAAVAGCEGLVAAGELDSQVGAELHAAISEAVVSKEKRSRLRALAKASNIAVGVSILSGISQTIGEIIQLLPR
jgi:predicted regulator of Ras-like GTPase activity (Roadblock/LC7/MglB family)